MSDRELFLAQVDRLVRSDVLRGSESLCKLLRFLTEKSLEHPATPLKEYEIATQVFGRPSYFDPRLDSTVRVQTGRLRSKLVEYYAGPGSQDELILGIPKGAYSLSFGYRQPVAAPPPPAAAPPVVGEAAESPPVDALPTPPRDARHWYVVLGVSALLAVGAFWWWHSRAPADAGRPSGAARAFWSVFLESKQPPFVVFSNAEFIGSPTKSTGMRYFDPATDSPRQIRDY